MSPTPVEPDAPAVGRDRRAVDPLAADRGRCPTAGSRRPAARRTCRSGRGSRRRRRGAGERALERADVARVVGAGEAVDGERRRSARGGRPPRRRTASTSRPSRRAPSASDSPGARSSGRERPPAASPSAATSATSALELPPSTARIVCRPSPGGRRRHRQAARARRPGRTSAPSARSPSTISGHAHRACPAARRGAGRPRRRRGASAPSTTRRRPSRRRSGRLPVLEDRRRRRCRGSRARARIARGPAGRRRRPRTGSGTTAAGRRPSPRGSPARPPDVRPRGRRAVRSGIRA